MEPNLVLQQVHFTRDGAGAVIPATPDELVAHVAAPEFDFVVAEPIDHPLGAGGDVFAQVVDLGGTYLFEVHEGGDWDSTTLSTPDEVVQAFLDWAQRFSAPAAP